MYHLIVIQEEQRDAMYDLAHHMKCLRGCVSTLEHVYSDSPLECAIARNQHATLECLWQQKVGYVFQSISLPDVDILEMWSDTSLLYVQQLFDSLWAMLRDGSLLLKEVQNTHLNNCQSVCAAANEIQTFFERFIPVIHKSKVLFFLSMCSILLF